MSQPDERIDSFEKYLAWNKTLPVALRVTPASELLAVNSGLFNVLNSLWPGGWLNALYSEVCGERITGGTFSYQHMATKRWWMMRELQRFAIGQYMPVPQLILLELAKYTSTIPLPMTHFLHMSKEEPGMVAYTADFENGVRDRQLRIGFGKYMTKHAFWLLDHHVQRLEMMLRRGDHPLVCERPALVHGARQQYQHRYRRGRQQQAARVRRARLGHCNRA
jgi:hypothetical protein